MAFVVPTCAKRLGAKVFLLAAVAPMVAFVWTLRAGRDLDGDAPLTESLAWVPSLGLDITLRFDGLTMVMLLLITGIGVLVFAYSASYMGSGPGLGRFAATMLVFTAAMVGLVAADNLMALFLFWEATSISSFLLIGTNDEKAAARSGALQALLITGAGGLAMLGGFVLLGQAAGTYSLSRILADPPAGTAVDVALVLVLVGALTKSAQVPFHSWLPRAMNAPTPVSAFLHSATMVNAGVYLVARLSPSFATAAPWRPVVLCAGAATMLVGGYRSLRQHDLKLVLAHSTISQLGLMMILFGVGTEAATFAGVTLLVAHGVFKAALFMVVGIVDHQTHTRDLRVLGGARTRLAGGDSGDRRGRGVDGGHPAASRVHREGRGPRVARRDRRCMGSVARRAGRRRFDADRRLQRPVRLGDLRPAAGVADPRPGLQATRDRDAVELVRRTRGRARHPLRGVRAGPRSRERRGRTGGDDHVVSDRSPPGPVARRHRRAGSVSGRDRRGCRPVSAAPTRRGAGSPRCRPWRAHRAVTNDR